MLFIIGSLSLLTIPSYAQTDSIISVETSESSYEQGETIVVSGQVSAIIGETPVVIQIFYNNNLVEIDQITVAQDGSFTETILGEGRQWSNDGEYIVRASYGSGNIAEASFNFLTEKSSPETTNNFEVDAGSSGTFDVEYTIRGGTVSDMLVDSEIFALKVIIKTEDNGEITLKLDRDYIDALRSDGRDEQYIILIDGLEVGYEDIETTAEHRTISIDFQEGDSNIEIIGTFVVPEFGIFTMVILAITIVSVIVITRNKSMPIRYF